MQLTIRKTFSILIAVNLAAVIALIASYSLYQAAQEGISQTNIVKYRSYLLADELRQSSDDLTRLGRTYVTTGDSKYEKQYFDILDIRNGKKPRPVDYHRIYWDFFTVDMKKPRPDGETISLQALMQEIGFTEEEFGYLSQAQANSDGLVGLEVKAMNAVKGKFDDGSGNYTITGEPNMALARELVHSEEYHRFKAQIMEPLNKFFETMEARTANAVLQAEAEAAMYAKVMIAAIVAVVLVMAITIWTLIRRIMTPIGKLQDFTTALSRNDLSADIPATEQQDELGDLARGMLVFRTKSEEHQRLAEETRAAQQRQQERADHLAKINTRFDQNVGTVLDTVTGAINAMETVIGDMTNIAGKTSNQAGEVAEATQQASTNVATVSSASLQLSSSIQEISRQVAHSTTITGNAVEVANTSNERVSGLSQAAGKIGEVVQLINDIAEQTNLLALNATIEAARAGEAGKGFAVVASEVKNLATQTAMATDEISGQIGQMQVATRETVQSIDKIVKVIAEIDAISSSLAAAIEEQGAATSEISRNAEQASQQTDRVSAGIADVTSTADENKGVANQVNEAVDILNGRSAELRQMVDQFLQELQTA